MTRFKRENVLTILRNEYGLSQNDVARCLGLQRTYLNKVENGTRGLSTNALLEVATIMKMGAHKEVHEDRSLCEAMSNEDYFSTCEHECYILERELKQLNMLHRQYRSLKKLHARVEQEMPRSMWSIKMKERLNAMKPHLGPRRDIVRLSLEHYRREMKKCEERIPVPV